MKGSTFTRMMMMNRARTSMMMQPVRKFHVIASSSETAVDTEQPVLVYDCPEYKGKSLSRVMS